jgi:hypothetical protein
MDYNYIMAQSRFFLQILSSMQFFLQLCHVVQTKNTNNEQKKPWATDVKYKLTYWMK